MKRAAAAPAASPQRTIGEILLEHGYVTEEDLNAAVQRQQETGFPLGQILVEAGAITRLELASALAVQWADVAPARAPSEEEPKGRSRGQARREAAPSFEEQLFSYASPPPDEAWRDEVRTAARAFAQRLDAVELALDELREEDDTGDTSDVGAVLDERLGPLSGRLEEAFSRVDSLEGALLDVGAQSRASVEGIEGLREELARRAAVATAALEQLAARIEERAPASALDEVRAELGALAAGQPVDDAVHEKLAVLSSRVDTLADPTALEELRRALDSLAERPASDPVLAGRLEELAERLDGLAARVDGIASAPPLEGLDERFESLAARVEEAAARPATDPELDGRLNELAQRIDALADPGLLEDLRHALEAAQDRPAADPVAVARLDELTAQLDGLAGRLDGLAARLVATGPDTEAGPELAALADRIDALERSAAVDGAAAEASGDGPAAGELQQLARRFDEANAMWAEERAALEGRLSDLAAMVASSGAPAAASSNGESTPSAEHDLNRLWFAVERLSLQLTEHHRTLGMLMGGGGADDGRLDSLAARVEMLEAGIGASRPAAGSGTPIPSGGSSGAVHAELSALARKVEELAHASEAGREKLLTQIEQMMSSIDWRFQRLEGGGKAA